MGYFEQSEGFYRDDGLEELAADSSDKCTYLYVVISC